MYKEIIKNRKGLDMAVIIEVFENQKGLAFVMHGLGGWKEQVHIATFAGSFKEKGHTVVRFDTTNSFNESDGAYEDATVTNYYEDLEDVIAWTKGQQWYQEPFVLCGHSLGSMCAILYAEKFPHQVKALAPISTVVSGALSLEAGKHEHLKEEWKKTGWRVYESATVPGRMKRLPWSHMEDRLKYDVIKDADKLTMPVLLIVGEEDDSTPPGHQKLLYDALPGPKELHILKGAPHTFQKIEHLAKIKKIMLQWLSTIV